MSLRLVVKTIIP